MPKAKVTARGKAKAKKSARKVAKRARAAPPKRTRRTPSAGRVDPRVIAAIALALDEDRVASERAEQLERELSPWTALGRVRAVSTR